MRTIDRKWQRDSHFFPAARSGSQFRMAADSRYESRLAQYDFQRAALVTTQQKSRECVLQIALGLLTRMALRVDIEQVARGYEPLPLLSDLRGEFEFH